MPKLGPLLEELIKVAPRPNAEHTAAQTGKPKAMARQQISNQRMLPKNDYHKSSINQ